ncbi:MAG: hypothetical protein MI785_08835 [Kiloniellales bacterium]|nr:hypothetical protein [Kiloniellales bacterium]
MISGTGRTQASGAPITHDRSYLYRTARNLVIDQSRRLARRRTDVVANQDLWRVCRKTARRRNAPPPPAGSSTDCARPSKSCRNERGRSSSSAAWKA